jgi:hypothetical protein
MNATTDEQGRFVFERVPPGPHRLFRVLNLHEGLSGPIGLSHHTNVLVTPGEITRITLGGTGRKVVGRVVTEPSNVRVAWAQQLQRLVQVRNEPAPKPDQFPDMTAYHQAWRAHDAAQNQSYFEIAADGTFVIDDVGPGVFQLEIKAVAPRPQPLDPERFEKPETILGSLKKTVTIPGTTTDGNTDVFDLGTVLIPLKNGHE